MLSVALSPIGIPELEEIIFSYVPSGRRLTVLPVVCKRWNELIVNRYGKAFDIKELAQRALAKLSPSKSAKNTLDRTLKSYQKSIFDPLRYLPTQRYVHKNFPAECFFSSICPLTNETSMGFSYYKSRILGGPNSFELIYSPKKKSFHLKTAKEVKRQYLRMKCELIFRQTIRSRASGREQFVDAQGRLNTTCCLVNSVPIENKISVFFRLFGGEMEKKSTFKGRKIIKRQVEDKYQPLINQAFIYLNMYYCSEIHKLSWYNYAQLADIRSIEELEMTPLTYICDDEGRILRPKQSLGPHYIFVQPLGERHVFELVITSISTDGKILKTLSWNSPGDDFTGDLASSMRLAVYAGTTKLLVEKLNLDWRH